MRLDPRTPIGYEDRLALELNELNRRVRDLERVAMQTRVRRMLDAEIEALITARVNAALAAALSGEVFITGSLTVNGALAAASITTAGDLTVGGDVSLPAVADTELVEPTTPLVLDSEGSVGVSA